MNGVHDLGGMHGFGAVATEEDELPFHYFWEKRVFGMTMSTIGSLYNLDEFRHAIERMGAAEYLSSTYYEHWLAAMEALLVEKGIVTVEELQSCQEKVASIPSFEEAVPQRENPDLAEMLAQVIQQGVSTQRPVEQAPRFQPGDGVIVRKMHPFGHTRCPRYVRAARGVVELAHGAFVFPDANAHLQGEQPEPVYTVGFDAVELWGNDYSGANRIYVDLWESYLEPA
ncbi:MAG: nitrile hydratase subunit beta [Elainellaceae cyanobacterium]